MDFSTGLSIVGIGTGIVVNLLAMKPMRPMLRGGLFGVGWLCIAAGLWGVLRGPVVGSGSEDMKVPKTMVQERSTNSPSISGSGNTTVYNMNPEKKDQVEPTTLGKCVCTTDLPAKDGKRALLVEFGVCRGETDGFYGEVHFVAPYEKRESWMGLPLRTDTQGGGTIKTLVREWDDQSHLYYGERFESPAITHHRSYYLYFEADQPLRLKTIIFIEDLQALSDQVRAGVLAKQVDVCPR